MTCASRPALSLETFYAACRWQWTLRRCFVAYDEQRISSWNARRTWSIRAVLQVVRFSHRMDVGDNFFCYAMLTSFASKKLHNKLTQSSTIFTSTLADHSMLSLAYKNVCLHLSLLISFLVSECARLDLSKFWKVRWNCPSLSAEDDDVKKLS